MARGLNKAILIGYVGREPVVNTTTSGQRVASFSIATTEEWVDQMRNRQSKSEWHNIVAWGKLADIVGSYVHTGKQVYIEGRIQTRSYQDKNGNDRYVTEIVANEMILLSSFNQQGNGGYSSADISGQAGNYSDQGYQGNQISNRNTYGSQGTYGNVQTNQFSGSQGSFGNGNVQANQVGGSQGGLGNVQANPVSGSQGGFGNVQANPVSGSQGGFGNVQANQVRGSQGGFGNVQANPVSGSQGGFGNVQANQVSGSQVNSNSQSDDYNPNGYFEGSSNSNSGSNDKSDSLSRNINGSSSKVVGVDSAAASVNNGQTGSRFAGGGYVPNKPPMVQNLGSNNGSKPQFSGGASSPMNSSGPATVMSTNGSIDDDDIPF